VRSSEAKRMAFHEITGSIPISSTNSDNDFSRPPYPLNRGLVYLLSIPGGNPVERRTPPWNSAAARPPQ
jgi:hypothetical protein